MRLKDLIRSVARGMNLPPENLVFLEGGLGSQLIGMLMYEVRRAKDKTTKCDVSYFFPEIHHPQTSDGATRWPWELHRYGIDLHDARFVRSRWYQLRASYEHRAIDDEPFAFELCKRRWGPLFPIVEEARRFVAEWGPDEEAGYAAIHLRRGDYLRVGARVIHLDEVLRFLKSIQLLLPEQIIFLSDDEFISDEVTRVRRALDSKECEFMNTADQHIAHGVMRLSRVLITSNSTFSWSAALMLERPDALAFAPEHFFAGKAPHVNNVFQAPATWMVLESTVVPEV